MAIRVRTVGELKPVLASADLPADKLPIYYMLGKPGENITILLPQMLGKEYPKTYGHYHLKKSDEVYTIAYGEGLVMMQKVGRNGEVLEVRLVSAFRGESVKIPGDCGHTLINIGSSPLITVDNYDPKKETHDYDSVTAKHGLGYYIVIAEKVGWEAIPNHYYKNLPPIILEKDNPL